MRDMRKALVFTFLALSVIVMQARQRGLDPAARAVLQRATAEDHADMMRQLGIRALRRGPSGDESAPNHANYDEAKANPFPDLPPVLLLKNGKTVTTADMWWKQRRPEILEDFSRDVFGRVPANAPAI